jgi:hypothetical protein
MDRHPATPAPVSVSDFARGCSEIGAELAKATNAIRATPISADLLRIRAVVDQRKAAAPRLTVAEVHELERTHRTVTEALEPYRQSAFSLFDLHNAVRDAGYEIDECGGDPAVFIPGATDEDRLDFTIAVAQASPRYAHAVLKAATWLPVSECFFWNAKEIARAAA